MTFQAHFLFHRLFRGLWGKNNPVGIDGSRGFPHSSLYCIRNITLPTKINATHSCGSKIHAQSWLLNHDDSQLWWRNCGHGGLETVHSQMQQFTILKTSKSKTKIGLKKIFSTVDCVADSQGVLEPVAQSIIQLESFLTSIVRFPWNNNTCTIHY